jgi:hypothetical protein
VNNFPRSDPSHNEEDFMRNALVDLAYAVGVAALLIKFFELSRLSVLCGAYGRDRKAVFPKKWHIGTVDSILLLLIHPSIRIAATRVSVPMLNIDKAEAVRLFLSLNSHPNDEVLRGHELSEFLGYALISHFDELRPILERMMASAIGEVAKRGAEWAVLMYLHTGKMKMEVDSCLVGSGSQRAGIATILSRELPAGRCDDTCLRWSAALLDDADESIRRTIAITFWQSELYVRPYAHQMFGLFIKSRAFNANIENALRGLKETTVPLTGFAGIIHATVDRLTEAASALGANTGSSSQDLADVLLRLYEQSESDPATRRKCLDVLDKALEDRLGYNITKAVDD